MEGLIDNAKKFLATEQGQKMEQQFQSSTGINVDQYLGGSGQGQSQSQGQGQSQSQGQGQATGDPQIDNQQSFDIQGNAGQPGQYGQEGQYGAVRGGGFGGGMAKDAQGTRSRAKDRARGGTTRAWTSMIVSTASGGYGRNAQGGAFSRQNQMAADQSGAPGSNSGFGGYGDNESDDGHGGYKTGTSTPGYRQEGDVDAEAAENRMRNQNMNVYGQQSNDLGSDEPNI
ncbi:hypothetical protein EHS25_009042 [Saitozyma podzolica]|uniref:Uncharacterized protein n=1 Tax=Saitozyma podzolica TaxID=1890683 RepID=A0A427YKP9_9TREE|nr:hypothetical protein EHS25_009042 [Saitozyma podzolica]